MAWTLSSENTTYAPYTVGMSEITAMAATQVNSDTIVHDMANKKLLVGINVTTAGTDVVATLKLQISHNGTDWVTQATAIADTTPNVTGVKLALVDLTDVYAPYYRLAFNEAAAVNPGTTGRFKFIFTSRT